MNRISSEPGQSRAHDAIDAHDPARAGGDTREARALYRSRAEWAAKVDHDRAGPRFVRTFWWLVGTLLVACGVFLAIAVLQGPKLTDAQVDASAVIERSDQQVRLFFNQDLVEVNPDQVTVSPATEFSVTTSGDLVTVQFGAPLLYATEYTVRLVEVRSEALPQPSSTEFTFTTASPRPVFLDRSDPASGEPDGIVRIGLTGSDRETIFSAVGIESFALTGQVLAVSSAVGDGTSRLQLVSLADGAIEEVRLPAPGTVTDLAASDVGSVLAFTFTPSVRGDDVLGGREVLVLDLEAGRALTPVAELGGDPLPVTAWQFVPGSTSIVVQGIEQTTFLVDFAAGGVPAPLGRFAEIVSISRDGSSMLARDALGAVVVSLADGSQERVEPSLIQGGRPFIGQAEVLANGDVIEKAALQTTDGRFVVIVAVDDGTEGRVLYQTPDLAGSIEDFTVSPNGQYVAIEVVPVLADSVSDGYAVDPRSTTITTVIVEISTGLIVRSVEGFALLW